MATKKANSEKHLTPKRNLSFIEILNTPEYRALVDQIEWGCSDREMLLGWIEELYIETGHRMSE